MGPIRDSRGVEQGGVNSDNFYKMVNNEQVQTSQDSELSVTIGDITVSCVAQADDVFLSTNNIDSLSNLLHLTHCSNYQIELVANKTKLQVFLPKSYEVL